MEKDNQHIQAIVLILILKLIQLIIKELHISLQNISVTHCMFWRHL